jgi:hypothetical protein
MSGRVNSLRRRLGPLLGAALLCVFSGACGDGRFRKTYPVKGQVLYEGKPAAGAKVFFHPQEYPDDPWLKPRGTVDDEGFFTLSSYRVDDGVPAGSYAVTVVWLPKGHRGPIGNANMLPERYSKKNTSGLTAEVKAGRENNLAPFQLHE